MAHSTPVHKTPLPALLRWGLIVVVCALVAVPAIVTNLAMQEAASSRRAQEL